MYTLAMSQKERVRIYQGTHVQGKHL